MGALQMDMAIRHIFGDNVLARGESWLGAAALHWLLTFSPDGPSFISVKEI